MFCVCRKGVRNPFFLPKAKLIITEHSKKVIFNFCLTCAAEAVCAAQTWNVARGARLRRFRALTFQATVSGISKSPEIVLKQIISPLYYCFAKDIIAQDVIEICFESSFGKKQQSYKR